MKLPNNDLRICLSYFMKNGGFEAKSDDFIVFLFDNGASTVIDRISSWYLALKIFTHVT